MSAARPSGKGPVKADHTIVKPGATDGATPAAPLGTKSTTERLRMTPSPTGDSRLRKTPSPTSVPAVRTHTPSPTSSLTDRMRKTPSPRTTGPGADKKQLVSPTLRPSSTTPRKTPSPSDMRRSPDLGGSLASGPASARKKSSPAKRVGGTLRRSNSAVLSTRCKDTEASSATATAGRDSHPSVSRSVRIRDRQLRHLITKDPSVIDTIAMQLAERRINGMCSGAHTTESGTQTLVDSGTQTTSSEPHDMHFATSAAMLHGSEADEDADADADDGEVAQIAFGKERGALGTRGITPPLVRSNCSSSVASDAPLAGSHSRPDSESALEPHVQQVPVEMMSGLGIGASAERPKYPTPVYSSGELHAARAARPPERQFQRASRSPSPATVTVGTPPFLCAAEVEPTRMMRPTCVVPAMSTSRSGSVAGAGELSRRDTDNSFEGELYSEPDSAGAACVSASGSYSTLPRSWTPPVHSVEPPGMLEQLRTLLTVQSEEDAEDVIAREMALNASPLAGGATCAAGSVDRSSAPGPDPIKMLSDGRHNATMLLAQAPHTPHSGASHSLPSSGVPSPQVRLRPSSRGPGAGDVGSGGGHEAHAPTGSEGPVAHDDAAGSRSMHRRTASWGKDDPCTTSAHARHTKSPKENGTSLFGSNLEVVGAAEHLSLPVAARARIPRLDLREMTDRPQTAPTAAVGGEDLGVWTKGRGGSLTDRKGARTLRGMVTSRSDVSIGSPRSAFTSVSSPRSIAGSTNSTPRNPLPPIVSGHPAV